MLPDKTYKYCLCNVGLKNSVNFRFQNHQMKLGASDVDLAIVVEALGVWPGSAGGQVPAEGAELTKMAWEPWMEVQWVVQEDTQRVCEVEYTEEAVHGQSTIQLRRQQWLL
ncbi:Multicopper oxidase [Vigna unguiculata]|uniref:Multicopper oxidase n=1 Tax=Vigna unguiculata TaxID=3917 RepID=A0A4D6NQF4_VIGUN|nr:Multicopper oxidase [Vigna unguiculata]